MDWTDIVGWVGGIVIAIVFTSFCWTVIDLLMPSTPKQHLHRRE